MRFMSDQFEQIIAFVLIVGMFYGMYSAVKAKIWVTKNLGYDYYIRFNYPGKIINLQKDSILLKQIKIVANSKDLSSYSVQSKTNDKNLKNYLMKQYHLTDQQVVVQTEQFSGPLGMI